VFCTREQRLELQREGQERERELLYSMTEKYLLYGLVHGSDSGRRAVRKGGVLNRGRSCTVMWVSPCKFVKIL